MKFDTRTTDNDEEQFRINLDAALKEAIDADPDTNKDITHDALRRELARREGRLIDEELAELREDIAGVEARIQQLDGILAEKRERVEQLEARRDEESDDEAYEAALEALLNWMETEGVNVFEGHPRVDELVSTYQRPDDKIIADLKDASDLPDERFQRGGGDSNGSTVEDLLGDGA